MLHLDRGDFIKTDGGGNLSAHIIFGSKKNIEKFKPILLIGCIQEKHKNLFEHLVKMGYIANYFNGIKLKSIIKNVIASNCFFYLWRGR